MNSFNLSPEKTQLVEAYGALQQIDPSATDARFTIEVNGKSQSIQATPEIVQAFQRGLTTTLLGKQDATSDVSFNSRDEVAQSLGVDASQLRDFQGKGDRFSGSEIMPWLHEQQVGSTSGKNA